MSKPTAAELELFDLLAKCNSLFVEVAESPEMEEELPKIESALDVWQHMVKDQALSRSRKTSLRLVRNDSFFL